MAHFYNVRLSYHDPQSEHCLIYDRAHFLVRFVRGHRILDRGGHSAADTALVERHCSRSLFYRAGTRRTRRLLPAHQMSEPGPAAARNDSDVAAAGASLDQGRGILLRGLAAGAG
eukprot:4206888-Pleurochrysis_carterae.AAC.2